MAGHAIFFSDPKRSQPWLSTPLDTDLCTVCRHNVVQINLTHLKGPQQLTEVIKQPVIHIQHQIINISPKPTNVLIMDALASNHASSSRTSQGVVA